MHGYSESKPQPTASSAIRGPGAVDRKRMVDEDKYCIEILDQVSAVSKARAVSVEPLDEHLKHCVTEAAPTPRSVSPRHPPRWREVLRS